MATRSGAHLQPKTEDLLTDLCAPLGGLKLFSLLGGVFARALCAAVGRHLFLLVRHERLCIHNRDRELDASALANKPEKSCFGLQVYADILGPPENEHTLPLIILT